LVVSQFEDDSMADTEEIEENAQETPKRSKLPLILGLVLGLAGGGGGFYAAFAGLLPFGMPQAANHAEAASAPVADFSEVVFVPVEPLVISLAEGGQTRHLRFRAELEVGRAHESQVTQIMPRVVDVLNTYLRALSIADLEESTALMRLRAQMLRRVQIVTGEGRINDLLIMEFVLN